MSTGVTERTFSPPVMEARRWLELAQDKNKPLINVSQAAPVDPPPKEMRLAMAAALSERDDLHLYGPVLGMPDLRACIAKQWSERYQGTINQDHVAITAGCNQAFAAAISAIAAPGDAVILPLPWYFNHKMWLDMAGITAIGMPSEDGLLPNVERCAKLITSRVRAICLVSPNNPTGIEYPPDLLKAFYELAKSHGIRIILDETYRDFHSQAAPVHTLFQQRDWDKTFIHLYSFSKAFRLTGHRVGALLAHPEILRQVEKFLDTVTICPPQLGQFAALWGLENLHDWLANERLEILGRIQVMREIAQGLESLGWQMKGLGAYFAYFEHPFEMPSDILAQKLVQEAGILLLPGTMFRPKDDPKAKRELRIAFANLDSAGLWRLFGRLKELRFTLAEDARGT